MIPRTSAFNSGKVYISFRPRDNWTNNENSMNYLCQIQFCIRHIRNIYSVNSNIGGNKVAGQGGGWKKPENKNVLDSNELLGIPSFLYLDYSRFLVLKLREKKRTDRNQVLATTAQPDLALCSSLYTKGFKKKRFDSEPNEASKHSPNLVNITGDTELVYSVATLEKQKALLLNQMICIKVSLMC